jgi:hypothetical protein
VGTAAGKKLMIRCRLQLESDFAVDAPPPKWLHQARPEEEQIEGERGDFA